MTDEERDRAIAILQAQVAELTRRLDAREAIAAAVDRALSEPEPDAKRNR